MMHINKFFSKDILNFNYETESTTVLELENLKRAYEIWEHARALIENNESEFHLSDGIANLKRSLNQRLQLIEGVYNLKSVKFEGKPKGYLELLEFFGIVRPFLMKQLLDIRNDIEHRDAKPPSYEKCLELLDSVWYFIKSTDYLVRYSTDTLVYMEDNILIEDRSWVELTYKFDVHKIYIRGRLSDDFVTNADHSIEIESIIYDEDIDDEDNKYIRANEIVGLNYFDGELKTGDSEIIVLLKKFLSNY